MADIIFGSGITIGTGINFQYPPPPPPYFITQGPTSGDSDNKSIALDSSGNIYSVGTLTSGSGDISFIKYDTNGTAVWQYKIDSGAADGSMGIHIDSSNNIFVVGRVGGGTGYTGTGNIWVAKFNTNGAIQWQRKMSDSDRWDDGSADGYCITSDSLGNLYVGGWLFNQMACLIKLNSSGVIQYFKMGNTFATNHLVIDSSDNLYIMTSGTGARGQEYGRAGTILKLNSSGTQIWQKTWAQGPGTTNYAGGLALSSSGSYLYASFSADNSDAFLAKLSTTDGSQAWQRRASGVGNEYGSSVAVDSSENIYWATSQLYTWDNNVGYNNQKAVIFKYNSSGTIQWQRQMYVSGIGYPNNFDYLNKIVVSGSDFYVGGHMNLTNISAKFPGDGTLTTATSYSVNGKSIVYNASTLSESNTGTLTLGDEATAQFTNLGSWIESATAFTPVATSFTITRVVIG